MNNSRNQSSFLESAGRFILGLLIESLVTGALWMLLTATPFRPIIESLLAQDQKAAWHLTRSVATVAYVLLTASTGWGLVLSSKIAKDITPAPITLEMHSTLSWIAVGLGAYHGSLLLLDKYYHYTLASILVPFIGPYRPLAVGLGTLGLYLMLLTSASFSWRAWLGQKNWRRLHYATFAAYGLVTAHGLLAGTDSSEPGMRLLYLGSVALVMFLTYYRLLAGQKQRREAPGSRSDGYRQLPVTPKSS